MDTWACGYVTDRTAVDMNSRKRALNYLVALLTTQQSLSTLFTPETEPLTKMLCIGVCRYYFGIQAFLEKKIKKKPEPMVWACLLLGVYQLLYLDKPVYATVKETVALLDKTRFVHAKGLVNAILRDVTRHKPTLQEIEAPWLLPLLQKDWPHDWKPIVTANHQHAPLFLRVNLHRTTRDDYLALLKTAGMPAVAHEQVPSAVQLLNPVNVSDLPGFSEGLVSVQDVSAQGMAMLWHIEPSFRVLDACAAPGGKTGHLLEMCPTLKTLLAIDKDEKRVKRILDNLSRLKYNAKIKTADAQHIASWWDGVLFDRILLDAPCSATGVIRRHPDIRLLRTCEAIQSLMQTQMTLLKALWQVLAVQGQLLYITCSVLKVENDQQISAFLKGTPDACVREIKLPYGRKTDYGWQCLPGEAEGDGFYYALLEKDT